MKHTSALDCRHGSLSGRVAVAEASRFPLLSDEDLAKRGRTRAQWEEMGRQGREMWNAFTRKRRNVPVYYVKLNGVGHMSYSDAPFVMPDTINRCGGRIIDAARGHEVMPHDLGDFFGKYLSRPPSAL